MPTDVLPNGKPGFTSRTLGLGLWLDGSVLRFYDLETHRDLLTSRERALEANARAAALEAELAEVKAGTGIP